MTASPTIHVFNEQNVLQIDEGAVQKAIGFLFNMEQQPPAEVSVHLVDIPTISSLHDLYFDDPNPTDCISFPIDPTPIPTPYRLLGDIFVCPEVACQVAAQHALSPHQETLLYIIHAFLHLIGYDDIDPEEQQKMEKRQHELLALLLEAGCSLERPPLSVTKL